MQSALHLVAGKDPVQVLVPPVNENSKYVGGMGTVPVLGAKKAGPPPGRKMSGSIDVIGGGAPSLPSRRPGGGKEGVIQVIGSVEPGSLGGLTLPPTHVPPPGYVGLPMDASGMAMPPPIPGMIPGVPPPGYESGNFPPPRFTHPPPPIPGGSGDRSSGYDDRGSYYNGAGYTQTYGDDGGPWPPREGREGREREGREGRDRGDREGREGRDRDRSSRRGGGGMEYEEEEGRGSSRRYRDYYRDRERDRERGRERHERDEEYEERYERERPERPERPERRHREYREKEDRPDRPDRAERSERHRSSRRRHHRDEDEEEERRSSKHKHKRSKKERPVVVEEAEPATESTQDGQEEGKTE